MYPIVGECVTLLEEALARAAGRDGEVNLKKCFGNYTMDALCRSTLGIITNTHDNPNNPFVQTSLSFFNLTWRDSLRVFLFMLFPSLRKLGFSFFNPKPLNAFRVMVKAIIAERRRQMQLGNNFDDFLQTMLNSINQAVEEEGYTLSEDELIAQVFVFIAAGYETTAQLLSYLIYSLAVDQDCQEALLAEINQPRNGNGDIEHDTLMNTEINPYLDACIMETLRLYDPVILLNRTAIKDTYLGDLFVPKGTDIQIPVYAIHHDANHFNDPFTFDPDRFSPENQGSIEPYTYLPFGQGPRRCIGERFSLMEVKLAIFRLVKKFKFTPNEKTTIPIQFTKTPTTMLQCKDIIVSVELRQ